MSGHLQCRDSDSLLGRLHGSARGSICLVKVCKPGRQADEGRAQACVLRRHVARSFHLKKPPLFTQTDGRTDPPLAAGAQV